MPCNAERNRGIKLGNRARLKNLNLFTRNLKFISNFPFKKLLAMDSSWKRYREPSSTTSSYCLFRNEVGTYRKYGLQAERMARCTGKAAPSSARTIASQSSRHSRRRCSACIAATDMHRPVSRPAVCATTSTSYTLAQSSGLISKLSETPTLII